MFLLSLVVVFCICLIYYFDMQNLFKKSFLINIVSCSAFCFYVIFIYFFIKNFQIKDDYAYYASYILLLKSCIYYFFIGSFLLLLSIVEMYFIKNYALYEKINFPVPLFLSKIYNFIFYFGLILFFIPVYYFIYNLLFGFLF